MSSKVGIIVSLVSIVLFIILVWYLNNDCFENRLKRTIKKVETDKLTGNDIIKNKIHLKNYDQMGEKGLDIILEMISILDNAALLLVLKNKDVKKT